jgi:hypothetical protein
MWFVVGARIGLVVLVLVEGIAVATAGTVIATVAGIVVKAQE